MSNTILNTGYKKWKYYHNRVPDNESQRMDFTDFWPYWKIWRNRNVIKGKTTNGVVNMRKTPDTVNYSTVQPVLVKTSSNKNTFNVRVHFNDFALRIT